MQAMCVLLLLLISIFLLCHLEVGLLREYIVHTVAYNQIKTSEEDSSRSIHFTFALFTWALCNSVFNWFCYFYSLSVKFSRFVYLLKRTKRRRRRNNAGASEKNAKLNRRGAQKKIYWFSDVIRNKVVDKSHITISAHSLVHRRHRAHP